MRPRRSGQDVAPVSTETVYVSFGRIKLKLDAETLQVLLCLLSGYMAETMSGDRTALAFYAAKDYAEKRGVSEEKFVEVANAIFGENEKRRKKHPWIESGFMA